MKVLLFILLFIPFLSQAQFQPWSKADWELWNRSDHKIHMFVGQISILYPQLILTYADQNNPDFIVPLKYTIPISLGLTLGKEYILDNALGLGSPTYPDLIYGIIGTATGLIISYTLYKLERLHINKHEKLKL